MPDARQESRPCLDNVSRILHSWVASVDVGRVLQVPTLAAYPAMMRRDRHRLGLRECRAAWLLGITVRQYRQLEAGEADLLLLRVWDRMVEVFGWLQS